MPAARCAGTVAGETQLSNARFLAALIRRERDALLADWRRRVKELPSARLLDVPTLNDHVPLMLDMLAAALEPADIAEAPVALAPPAAHGAQRMRNDYDIEEVVSEYGLLRESLHALAEANGVRIDGEAFRILNRELNQLIGRAVRAYAHETATELMREHERHLAFVTHDLRTPLNAIVLAAGVLERALPEQPGDSVAARMLRSLRRNAEQLRKLLDAVLAAHTAPRPGAQLDPHLRGFELWPLVEGLVQEFEPLARSSGTRLVNAIPDELEIYADASLLGRAFRNLIENAIRHAPRGEIVIGAESAGDAVSCWVRDDGVGIERTRVAKVFDPGETTNAGNGGQGLGLAIVQQIVAAHGGTIHVASETGRGTSFRFDFRARTSGDAKA
jgi:signal transduction histidine kinase